jgi:hypothetical protein
MVLDPEVTYKIIEMTKQQTYAVKDNIYKETLRQLLHIFGGIYYLDANGNKINIKCTNGKQEKPVGSDRKNNTLVLPLITITESGGSNSDSRRRYNPVLVVEKAWNKKLNRAQRVLSLAPRPIDLTYEINLWAKYNEDLDIMRYSIFSLFNPDLDIRTDFSDYTKAFIDSESDIGTSEAEDTKDRLLRKSISIKVETYLPSPKFLFTNTGQIENIIHEVDIQTGGDEVG